jgi:hypothetical protein
MRQIWATRLVIAFGVILTAACAVFAAIRA